MLGLSQVSLLNQGLALKFRNRNFSCSSPKRSSQKSLAIVESLIQTYFLLGIDPPLDIIARNWNQSRDLQDLLEKDHLESIKDFMKAVVLNFLWIPGLPYWRWRLMSKSILGWRGASKSKNWQTVVIFYQIDFGSKTATVWQRNWTNIILKNNISMDCVAHTHSWTPSFICFPNYSTAID